MALQQYKRNTGRKVQLFVALVLAGIGVGLCMLLFGGTSDVAYHFVWVLAFIMITYLNLRFIEWPGRREQIVLGIFGVAFVSLQAIGFRLEISQNVGIIGWLICLGIGFCAGPGMGFLFILLENAFCMLKPATGDIKSRNVFWISFATILICWVPIFLAYYPGIFSYDVGTQISEIINWQLTNRNPILHTLYLGAFYLIGGLMGNYSLGIAMAVIVQMIIMAGIMAKLLAYLTTFRIPKLLFLLALIMFALLPIHSMMAISCTKDTLFSGLLLLYGIRLHQLSKNSALLEKPRWLVMTGILIVLICLLRNNAFFGILACLPLSFLVIPRARRMRMILLILGSLLASFGSSTILIHTIGTSGISPTELISVPAQQLSRVYALHHDEIPASVEIEYYLPTVKNYNPYTADPVKSVAIVNKPYRMWGFVKLWGKIGLQYPSEYIDAFLLTNRGYWWLDDTTHARIYGQGLAERQGYLLSDTKQGFGVVHTSLLPQIENLYEQWFSANDYQRIPVLSLLFAPSLYVWSMLFFFLCGLVRKVKGVILLAGFLLCHMFIPLFGACVLIRYAYPLVLYAPLVSGVLCHEASVVNQDVQACRV